MGKLVIVRGKKGSGKIAWMAKWYAEDPDQRRLPGTIVETIKFLERDKDVAIDADLLVDTEKHSVEVVDVA